MPSGKNLKSGITKLNYEMRPRKLDKAQIAEVKDLFDGSYSSIRELAKLFKVGETCILWAVNYKNYRETQTKNSENWRRLNPERVKAIVKKAVAKYYQSERGKLARKKYYQKNKERIKEMMRKYRKNK